VVSKVICLFLGVVAPLSTLSVSVICLAVVFIDIGNSHGGNNPVSSVPNFARSSAGTETG